MLKTYHEHLTPLSKINGQLFTIVQKHASESRINLSEKSSRRTAAFQELTTKLGNFEQQITSNYTAVISDNAPSKGGFGKTSEAGDFRISNLPEEVAQ